MSLILGILAQSGGAPAAASSFFSIATSTLGSSQSSVTFTDNGAWADYKHLQLRCSYRLSSGAQYITMKVNGDATANNYSFHFFGGEGVNPIFASGSANMMPYMAQSGSGADNYAFAIIDFLDFSSTSKNKTFRSLFGQDRNGSGDIALASGAWYNSSTALNEITLTPNFSATFASLSNFALYGIKG